MTSAEDSVAGTRDEHTVLRGAGRDADARLQMRDSLGRNDGRGAAARRAKLPAYQDRKDKVSPCQAATSLLARAG